MRCCLSFKLNCDIWSQMLQLYRRDRGSTILPDYYLSSFFNCKLTAYIIKQLLLVIENNKLQVNTVWRHLATLAISECDSLDQIPDSNKGNEMWMSILIWIMTFNRVILCGLYSWCSLLSEDCSIDDRSDHRRPAIVTTLMPMKETDGSFWNIRPCNPDIE